MNIPQWIPRRADLAGLILATLLGLACLALVRVLPPSPYISDVLIALLLGVLALNSPICRIIELDMPGADREPDVYAPGLRFCGKWVLRLGIIAMGLKVQTSFFGSAEVILIVGVCFFTLPSAFFVAQTLGALTGIRRPLADLIAGGTMICGASAVNAIAPISGSHRHEQGVAIAVMFLFSVVALICFRPIAVWTSLDPSFAGIWSGLAVNDLSSAIAVGSQMGGSGDVMASAAKSARILMLAPTLMMFSLIRREGRPKDQLQNMGDHLPKFVLGYLFLAILRSVGDRIFGHSAAWASLFTFDNFLVDLTMSTVSAGIGLHLALRTLLASGATAAVVGGGAAFTIAGLSLAMITLASRGMYEVAGFVGGAFLLVSTLAHRMVTSKSKEDKALRQRFLRGCPLALAEATRVLDGLEADNALDDQTLCKLINQLHPAIGELIPIRESPLPHGEGCRWVTYWEGASGWALVAICREPGAITPIHAHPHRMLGKAIEGILEELTFDEIDAHTYRLRSRKVLGHNELVETPGLSMIHVVHAVGDRAAFDLQLRGPEMGSPGRRLRTKVEPLLLAVGATFQAEI